MKNLSNTYYSKDQDIRFTMTTPEEEQELWRKAKDEHHEPSREFLIQNHLLFAMMQAERMVAGRLPRNEVTSAANFAVMKAYERFEYQRGYRFTTYLRPFIRGEVSALWKSKFSGGIADPSLGSSTYSNSERGQARLSQHDSDSIHSERVCVRFSSDHVDHEAEKLDLDKFNGKALVAAVATLSKKDQALIRMVYVHGKNMADVGRQRGVSRAAVQSTRAKIIKKLKRLLKKKGVER